MVEKSTPLPAFLVEKPPEGISVIVIAEQGEWDGEGGEWGWGESFPMNGFAGNNTISL